MVTFGIHHSPYHTHRCASTEPPSNSAVNNGSTHLAVELLPGCKLSMLSTLLSSVTVYNGQYGTFCAVASLYAMQFSLNNSEVRIPDWQEHVPPTLHISSDHLEVVESSYTLEAFTNQEKGRSVLKYFRVSLFVLITSIFGGGIIVNS